MSRALGLRLEKPVPGVLQIRVCPAKLVLTDLQGYKPADEPASQYQTIPMNKIEDFGVHCQQYYSLDISYFKSDLDNHMLDLLWNKYWVNTLSSSPLLATRELATGQMRDIGWHHPGTVMQATCCRHDRQKVYMPKPVWPISILKVFTRLVLDAVLTSARMLRQRFASLSQFFIG